MPIPIWSVGQVLAASDVNNWLVPAAVYRTTNATSVLNTTFTNDGVLFFPMASGGVYAWELYLRYGGSVTGGFKWRAQAAGASGSFTGFWGNAGGGIFAGGNNFGDSMNITIGTLDAVYDSYWTGTITCGASPVNFQVQYAENATDAVHGSYIRLDSYLTAQRIA